MLTNNTTLNLTADTAVMGCGDADYTETAADGHTVDQDFGTVDSSGAYGDYNSYSGGHQYLTMSQSGDTVTYTFSGLAPGNYEVWEQHVANSAYPTDVTVNVYDGMTCRHIAADVHHQRDAVSGRRLVVPTYDNYVWRWSGGACTATRE